MLSRSRNPLLTFLLSYDVWVTSKIQVNFRFERYWWFCLIIFWNFHTIHAFEVREIQTDKHVRSACWSKSALFRYKKRHDQILDIIAKWISVNLKEEFELFFDLDSFQPLAMIIDSLRPDIAITTGKSIITHELTICHESNIQSSKTYKLNKYRNLSSHLLPSISKTPLKTIP